MIRRGRLFKLAAYIETHPEEYTWMNILPVGPCCALAHARRLFNTPKSPSHGCIASGRRLLGLTDDESLDIFCSAFSAARMATHLRALARS